MTKDKRSLFRQIHFSEHETIDPIFVGAAITVTALTGGNVLVGAPVATAITAGWKALKGDLKLEQDDDPKVNVRPRPSLPKPRPTVTRNDS